MKPVWWITKDGDQVCYKLARRHYSAWKNKQPKQKQFVGPGEQIVLRTWEGDAVFAWRRTRYVLNGQTGVCCVIFRNESRHRSSDLIRQADAIADFCWPGERHYTYVDAKRVQSENPGFCFLCAGWRKCGKTKRGLLILERIGDLEEEA